MSRDCSAGEHFWSQNPECRDCGMPVSDYIRSLEQASDARGSQENLGKRPGPRTLHPLRRALGDGHHTEEPFTDEDGAIGDVLARHMGTLDDQFTNAAELWEWWYRKRTPAEEWSRVARALRIHGLRVADR